MTAPRLLGYYNPPRAFVCAACVADDPTHRHAEAEETTTATGLDYAREQCSVCQKWVDENGGDER